MAPPFNKNICPDCGSTLVKRNRKDGSGQFWGCSAWKPNGGCTFKRDQRAVPRPISWQDSFNWGKLNAVYLSIGSAPGFLDLKNIDKVKLAPSKTLLITRTKPLNLPNPHSLVCQGVSKLLLRGEYGFSGFAVEKELLKTLPAELRPKAFSNNDPEIGYEELLEVKPNALIRCLADRFAGMTESATLDHVAFDSHREATFFKKWVPTVLGPKATAWFTPQAPLDMLLNACGEDNTTFRRADFMFYIPGYYPVIIEIDGDDHKQKRQADKERDAVLAKYNIRTVRIPNQEIDNLEGSNLEELAERCKEILKAFEGEQNELHIAQTLLKSSECSQLQYALLHTIIHGFPVSESGKINVKLTGDVLPKRLLQATLEDLNELLRRYSALFEAGGVKPICFSLVEGATNRQDILSIRLQFNASPATLEGVDADADVILCRAILPAELLPPQMAIIEKPSLCLEANKAAEHLTFFLNYIFRKREFRGQQLEAIINVLSNKDTLVLQPTGAGKSIIYQLSGQLLPGVTIVIDPIKALIEDQVRGLNEHRISRAAGLMSRDSDPLELQRMMAAIAANNVHYILMSPERLLVQSFRDSLFNLMQKATVNLAVIDEAHCLSQWGHAFRFAYLRLADNLRKYCSDKINGSPKLLAMTGTASRTVLKEMIAEIGINLRDEESVVKPSSFNRPELHFSVLKLDKGGATFGELNNMLQDMPSRLKKDREGFFETKGRQTNSGIVFTPHARSATHGLISIREQISKELIEEVGVFASTAPKSFDKREWETVKARHAAAFKNNQEAVLIATNAFGMGVDKPNIRWTIHMGIPSSIEAFYQEAGRAGRDRKPSHCAVIYSESDQDYTNRVLDPSNSLEQMRSLNQNRKPADDVDRALYFHLNSFSSVDEEQKLIKVLLELVDNCASSSSRELSYSDSQNNKAPHPHKEELERAIVRMSYCGLIEDYTTNYSGNTFNVTFAKYDYANAKRRLQTYISKVQPAQLEPLSKKLDAVSSMPMQNQPLALCEVIIQFTYDTIERSRRRMMLEAVQMARNGTSDAQIRDRLLNYLEEGANAARVSELAEAQTIEFSNWLEMSDSLSTRSDARELRGDVSRMLESYPYHAGLLLTRSVSEALSGNGDKDVIKDNLRAALLNETVNEVQLGEVIIAIMRRTNEGLQEMIEPLLEIIIEGYEKGEVALGQAVLDEMQSVSVDWNNDLRNVVLQFEMLVELNKALPPLFEQADNISRTIEYLRD